MTDLAHTTWRSDLARVEVLDETHFVEHTKSGYATSFTVTDCKALRRWAFTMGGRLRGGRGRHPADLHRDRQRQALVDAPRCPWLFEAAAEAVSG